MARVHALAIGSIDPHQPVDVRVVTRDDVGVSSVSVFERDRVVVGVGHEVIAIDTLTRASEDQIRAVRALVGRPTRVNRTRAAADDVVLTEVAEDDVVAAVALDVVVAIRVGLEGGVEVRRFELPGGVYDDRLLIPRPGSGVSWIIEPSGSRPPPAASVAATSSTALSMEPSPWIVSLPS